MLISCLVLLLSLLFSWFIVTLIVIVIVIVTVIVIVIVVLNSNHLFVVGTCLLLLLVCYCLLLWLLFVACICLLLSLFVIVVFYCYCVYSYCLVLFVFVCYCLPLFVHDFVVTDGRLCICDWLCIEYTCGCCYPWHFYLVLIAATFDNQACSSEVAGCRHMPRCKQGEACATVWYLGLQWHHSTITWKSRQSK